MKMTSLVESTNQYKALTQDCSHFLEQFKNGKVKHEIYRGAGSSNKLQKNLSRTGRVPVDTPMFFHDIADGFFYTNFNVKARSDATFCSTSRKQAKLYGYPCGVVPSGKNYQFIYSPIIRDMYNDIIAGVIDKEDSIINQINPSIKKELESLISNLDGPIGSLERLYDNSTSKDDRNIIAHAFLNTLKSAQYYMDDTLEHINENVSEVMLAADEYYMVPLNSDDIIRMEYDYNIYF